MDIRDKKVLVTCGGGVGDIIMYTPALRRLKEKYGCYIGFYTPRNYELVEGLPYIDEVIYAERGKAFSKFRVIPKIKGYDAVIITDWQPVVLMAAMLFGAKIRAGFKRADKKISCLYTKNLTHKWHKTHEYVGDNNAKLIGEALGVVLDGDMTHCEVSEPSAADARSVDNLMRDMGLLPQNEFIVLAPFTNFELKNIPMADCHEIIRGIKEKYNLPVVVLGGPGDYEQAAELSSYNLAGKTSIRDMIELMGRAKVMITADSGPMHVAGAVGTKIIALFGKEIPQRWAPKRNCWPLTLNFPCSPCKDDVARTCEKKVACLRDIGAARVLAKLSEIIDI